MRKAGLRVVYQPLSKVIHFEGVSNGTDVNGTGLKRYQVENSRKLREKWAEEFKKQCVNTGNPNPFRARERSQGKPVILVVDHYVPTFDKDAGSKTTYQYLKMFLKKGYVVKFLGDNFLHEEPYSTVLQQMGVEILYGPEYQAGIWDWIMKNKDEIDFAYLNRPHIAVKYVDFLKQNTDIKIIYYGHDLHFLREYREYELTGDIQKKRDSDYWKSIEFSLMEKAAAAYYPSYVEEEAIHAVKPELPVKAITAYVYETFLENIDMDFAKREGLLFVGGFGPSAQCGRGPVVCKGGIPSDPGEAGCDLLRGGLQGDGGDPGPGAAGKRHCGQGASYPKRSWRRFTPAAAWWWCPCGMERGSRARWWRLFITALSSSPHPSGRKAFRRPGTSCGSPTSRRILPGRW